jgi:VanZ family protein
MRSSPRSAFPNTLLGVILPFSRTARFLVTRIANPLADRDTAIENRALSKSVRAWILVAAYLLVLYASLPVMPRIWNQLDSFLGGHGLRAIYAATGALLAIPPVIMAVRGAGALRTYLAYAAFCFLLFAMGTLEDNPGEKIHMLQYALLGILVHWALGQHRLQAGSELGLLVFGILICMAAGALDETIQYFLPGRTFTWHDVFVNGASGVLTVLVLAYCLPRRRGSVNGGGRRLHANSSNLRG